MKCQLRTSCLKLHADTARKQLASPPGPLSFFNVPFHFPKTCLAADHRMRSVTVTGTSFGNTVRRHTDLQRELYGPTGHVHSSKLHNFHLSFQWTINTVTWHKNRFVNVMNVLNFDHRLNVWQKSSSFASWWKFLGATSKVRVELWHKCDDGFHNCHRIFVTRMSLV